MKILLTGASGFLGKTLIRSFRKYDVTALGRTSSDIIHNLTSGIPDLPSCEIVLHAAGKAHSFAKTKAEKLDFFNVNFKGTANLLKGIERSPVLPKSFVFVSSVSVYGLDHGILIGETFPLNAKDPYGLSKIQAEQIIQDWCAKNSVICSILRLPLIAGPTPPGNLRSMVRGIKRGYYFNIAGGKAKKSIVLAEDIAKIIPKVAEVGGIYNLTDGYHPSFSELAELIAKQLGRSRPTNIPIWLAKLMARSGDILGSRAPINSDKLKKITSDLTFDDSKARLMLGWNPTPVLEGFKIKESQS